MIPQILIVGAAAYWLLKESRTSKPGGDDTEPSPSPTPNPPPSREFEKIYRWSGEEIVGDSVVWFYESGVRYDDGEEVFDSPYIVIGDAAHHNFLRQSVSGGTINISKEATGGSTDQKNVKVFPSIEAAVEELSEDDEPSSPTDPQREPEDDDSSPTLPSLPTRPDYGLGDMTPRFGGM